MIVNAGNLFSIVCAVAFIMFFLWNRVLFNVSISFFGI